MYLWCNLQTFWSYGSYSDINWVPGQCQKTGGQGQKRRGNILTEKKNAQQDRNTVKISILPPTEMEPTYAGHFSPEDHKVGIVGTAVMDILKSPGQSWTEVMHNKVQMLLQKIIITVCNRHRLYVAPIKVYTDTHFIWRTKSTVYFVNN